MVPTSSAAPEVVLVGVLGPRDLKRRLPEIEECIKEASLVIGKADDLEVLLATQVLSIDKTTQFSSDMAKQISDSLAHHKKVAVLCSGDPGFFGLLRAIKRASNSNWVIRCIPAPSSVAVAFAMLGEPWEDALVFSFHGRGGEREIQAMACAAKAAALTSPEMPPERLIALLEQAGARHDRIYVASDLGGENETITTTTLKEGPKTTFNPRSVVIAIESKRCDPKPKRVSAEGYLSSPRLGTIPAETLGSSCFTKPFIRAAIGSLLELPPYGGVFYDIGAGTGAVSIEVALSSSLTRVVAIERNAEKAADISRRAEALGARIEVVVAEASRAIETLKAPTAAFFGGGGPEPIELALKTWGDQTSYVATFARLEPALEAFRLLGNMVELAERRAENFESATRLIPANPVYLVWKKRDG